MGINEKNYCVYVHINKINGKMYVGQTCQKPEDRWKSGYGYRKNTHFGKAIKKYGWDNFEHIIVAENLDKEKANYIEMLLISGYNTQNQNEGYNHTAGGEGMTNFKHTEESKKKMSEANKGKHLSEETKKKISIRLSGVNNPLYGKPMSEEHKQKLKKPHKPMSEESKQRIVNAHKKPVMCIETGIIYASAKDAQDITEINAAHIGDICRGCGERKTAGGYHWQYYIAETTAA